MSPAENSDSDKNEGASEEEISDDDVTSGDKSDEFDSDDSEWGLDPTIDEMRKIYK